MSFMTVLEKIGHDIAVVFEKAVPIAEEAQVIATPFENAYAPGLAQVINLAMSKIVSAESLAAAAGQQTGSGGTKLAFVASSLAPEIAPILATMGVQSINSTQYNTFISALVTALNAFTTITPSPTGPATITSAAPITGAVVPGK